VTLLLARVNVGPEISKSRKCSVQMFFFFDEKSSCLFDYCNKALGLNEFFRKYSIPFNFQIFGFIRFAVDVQTRKIANPEVQRSRI
jgi:hypothetical protein